MAKKDPADANTDTTPPIASDNKKNKKDKDKKGGLLGKLILTVVFLAIVAFLAGVLMFNFAGLRESYLRGLINNIPILNNMLPAPADLDDGGDPRNLMTHSELISQLDALQGEVDKLNNDKEDLTKRIGIYTTEIQNLRAVEEQLDQFRNDKNEFDRLVALNNPAAYTKFYESISPENADILYREALGSAAREQELKRLTNTVAAMEDRSAARMLEALMSTDMDLVVLLLKNISTDTSGSIINSMTAENAAAVVRWMAPQE
jgi:flagellar motility protein MotE (MotC chaperone)